jgi:ABC-type branched-subunit amino acid transport system ATPase component
VEGLSVRFGGLVAVSSCSLEGAAGSITGLIGPNGAGKTTIFNACTGSVSISAGEVWLGDERLATHSTANRAARGLGRTFQRMELFDSMTVAENVAIGPEAFRFGSRRWGHVVGTPREHREIQERAGTAIDRCGIQALAGMTVGALSTGQRRLVELARALATPFKFLLLDEPSSGLDVNETENFGQILRGFVAEAGLGVLLVEHDMTLVSSICSHVYVLDFGQVIFSGTASEMLSSDVAKAAYLGEVGEEGSPTAIDLEGASGA